MNIKGHDIVEYKLCKEIRLPFLKSREEMRKMCDANHIEFI